MRNYINETLEKIKQTDTDDKIRNIIFSVAFDAQMDSMLSKHIHNAWDAFNGKSNCSFEYWEDEK